jgi:hypothetical protein
MQALQYWPGEPVTRFLRRCAAALAVIALGSGLALATALPARADTGTVLNATSWWDRVNDNALDIQNTQAYYPDLFGSGDTVRGASGHAVNHFILGFTASDGAETLAVTTVPQQFDLVDGGLSTVRATASVHFASGAEVDFTVTLEIQGSYARWTIVGATDDDIRARVSGSTGSGGDSRFLQPSPTTLVSSDGIQQQDTVAGYQVTGTDVSVDVTDGDPAVDIDFAAAGTTTIALAVGDHDYCGQADAIADMVARVPTLGATFGEDIAAPDTHCLTVAQPLAFAAGAATDQTLQVTDISNWQSTGTSALDQLRGADFLAGARLYSSGLPAGLTLGYDTASKSLRLQGTAAQGSYPVRIALAFVDQSSSPAILRTPVFATLAVTVTAADAGGGTPDGSGPELAATGAPSPSLAVLAGLLLLAGGGALAARRELVRG